MTIENTKPATEELKGSDKLATKVSRSRKGKGTEGLPFAISRMVGIRIENHNLGQEDLKPNPEFEKLVPRPTDEEFEALKISLENEGQINEIVVDQTGTILDGYTRYSILKTLNREIKFEVRQFADKEAERQFIIRASLLRRNINAFQKIILAQPLIAEERVKAAQRQRAGKKEQTSVSGETKVGGDTFEIVARQIGVSRSTFYKGSYILLHGTEEMKNELAKGLRTINGVYALLREKEKTTNQGNSEQRGDTTKEQGSESKEEGEIHSDQPGRDGGKEIDDEEEGERSIRKCTFCRREFDYLNLRSAELCGDCISHRKEFEKVLTAVRRRATATGEKASIILERIFGRAITELNAEG